MFEAIFISFHCLRTLAWYYACAKGDIPEENRIGGRGQSIRIGVECERQNLLHSSENSEGYGTF